MALLKAQEVRQMSAEDRQRRLTELRGQLMNERGIAAMGGSPPSPGKIRQIRTAIARILTIQNQERQGAIQWAKGETPRAAQTRQAAPRKAAAPASEGVRRPASAQGRANQLRSQAINRAAAASRPKPTAKPAPAKPSARAAPKKKTTKKEE